MKPPVSASPLLSKVHPIVPYRDLPKFILESVLRVEMVLLIVPTALVGGLVSTLLALLTTKPTFQPKSVRG